MSPRSLAPAQRRQLALVAGAAKKEGRARDELCDRIREAREMSISLQRIADAAGISREKTRVLAGEATYQKVTDRRRKRTKTRKKGE